MYSRLGIHELKPTPNEYLVGLNPQVVVTVGTYEHGDAISRHLARVRLLKQLLPNAVIGVRWWPDDHVLDRLRPSQFAQAFFKLHVPGTVLMVGNEDANDPNNIAVFRDTINKHLQVMKLAHAEGIEIGTCCVATGNPALTQYKMLAPLFAEMADGRKRGLISWWRPNAYFTANNSSHVYRHIEQGRLAAISAKVDMPPTFLGELGFVRNFHEPERGYHSVGMGDGEYVDRLRALKLKIPAAIYSYGEGVYDNRWRDFAVTTDFMRMLSRDVERTPNTAYRDWQLATKNRIIATIKSTKANYANLRSAPTTDATIVGAVRKGDLIEYEQNAERDVYGRFWHLLHKPVRGYLASWVVDI
jgi:hypothetical protein